MGFVVILFFYTVPTWLAYALRVPHAGWIAAFNIILGWTIIGWLVALSWALWEAVWVPDIQATATDRKTPDQPG
ncbi:superinfection immunity protein [Acidithiobacillus sp. M4-SHS-6]|uniref:superinfection immunity protein n=1 Tax=Acidithiobacillus sp. M4-SHS-6 TaxID=3383024 RepID=UPI0039BDC421